MRVRHRARTGAVLWRPLVRASRTLGQFPFVVEEIFEEVIAPLRRRLGPNHFEAAGNRLITFARAKAVSPAKPLLLYRSALGFRADILFRISRAVSFAEGVAACDEGNGFLVIHRHAAEGFANVSSRSNRVRLSIRTFGIHVNQSHLYCAEGIIQFTIALVALVP